MGFQTALSGLKASSVNLQTIGNNIANSQTTGFKESRAEFADVYASSLGGVSKTQPGAGVKVSEVAQQFNQGNIEPTQNSLDLAISGNGFFALADEISSAATSTVSAAVTGGSTAQPAIPTAYTRNGAFQLDKSGNVINDQGRYLLAFAPNGTTVEQGFSVGVFKPLQIDTSQGLPTATKQVNMKLNLDGSSTAPASAFAFSSGTNTPDPLTYNNTTSITTYDSQGNSHIATTYFVKTANPNEWNAYFFLDGRSVTPGTQSSPADPVGGTPATIATGSVVEPLGTISGAPLLVTFNSSGKLLPVTSNPASTVPGNTIDFGDINLTDIDPNLSVDPMTIRFDYTGTTQFSTPFSVNGLDQNGAPAGNLTGVDVDKNGVVFARYSNGGAKVMGQVALARFQSNQALAKLGDTTWGNSSESGAPVYGSAGGNNFGTIQSAALEGSNVDLAEQLVKLIVAQQSYQANSQTVSTEKTLIETILRA